jgi:hypothetical protein
MTESIAAFTLLISSYEEGLARIGDQTGARVGYFLQTSDFDRDYHALTARGVRFLEAPRHEP